MPDYQQHERFGVHYLRPTSVDKHPGSPSFHKLFGMMTKDAKLAPGLDVVSLKRRLKKQKGVLGRVKGARNKRAAHWDMEIEPAPVLPHELKELLRELQSIFNEIYEARTGRNWSFQYWEVGGTSALLDTLSEAHRARTQIFQS